MLNAECSPVFGVGLSSAYCKIVKLNLHDTDSDRPKPQVWYQMCSAVSFTTLAVSLSVSLRG